MFMLATEQKHPLFSTDPNELERLAKEKLSEGGWLYASSNAGNSFTHRANREGKLARFMESIPHLTRDWSRPFQPSIGEIRNISTHVGDMRLN
jgi:hypothetical protein